MKKKAVVLIATILMMFSFFKTTVFADEKITDYSIDLTTVNSDVKKYLTSLSIDENNVVAQKERGSQNENMSTINTILGSQDVFNLVHHQAEFVILQTSRSLI